LGKIIESIKQSEGDTKLIFWISTTAVALLLGIGTPLYKGTQNKFDSQQYQIEVNREKIWEQQRTGVTEETLTRRFEEIMQIVDTKIGGIQTLQREQSRQLELLIQSQGVFQQDIREVLRDKVDK
jgi:uncharacterized protein HemX